MSARRIQAVPCLGVTPLLFPVDGDGEDVLDSDPPAFCITCPERLPCLERGWLEPVGLWGGTNPEQRMQARINKQTPEELWQATM